MNHSKAFVGGVAFVEGITFVGGGTPVKKIFFLFVFSIGMFATLFCDDQIESSNEVEDAIRAQISSRVREEIGKQLGGEDSVHVDFSDAESSEDVIRKKVASQVQSQIKRQLFSRLNSHAKETVYETDEVYKKITPNILFVYKAPRWPRQAQVFLKKDLLGVDVNFDFATQMYGSSGSTKDISMLAFREETIRLKDILLASNLIDKGVAEVASSKYNFLDILKDQIFSFDSSTDSQEIVLSYIRHFLRGNISLGLKVPFVRRSNKIRLTSRLSAGDKESLETNSTDFFSTYPNGLIDLFKDILDQKNIHFDDGSSDSKSDVEAGVGDVEIFFNYEIPTQHCERCFVGLRGLFPTSRRRDTYELWGAELGNGGFPEVSAFGSLLFGHSRFLNPHCFVQATYAFPATMFRRVPKLVSNSDIEDVTTAKIKFGNDFMLYGNGVKYLSTEPEFSELDSSVRRFADGARKTKIHKGGNLFIRVGNIFENIFSEKTFFDFYYDLFAKWRDYVGFRREGDVYDASLLVDNTYEVAFGWKIHICWAQYTKTI